MKKGFFKNLPKMKDTTYLRIKMEQVKNIQHEKTQEEKREDRLVRIMSNDIEGKMMIYSGLTKIKGVSWSLSNATCKILKIDKKKRIGLLTKEEIDKISDFLKNPKVPAHLVNRRKDFDSGEDKHLIGSNLELQKEFDIKRLKKIKSYRGIRHTIGQPVRGQRTKSHFRSNRKRGSGIKRKEKVA